MFSLILVFLMSFFLGKDFYYRTNPKVLEQRIALDKHVMRNIDPEEMTIMWKLDNSVTSDFEKYFYFEASLVSLNKKTGNSYYDYDKVIPVESKRCDDPIFENSTNFINKSSGFPL